MPRVDGCRTGLCSLPSGRARVGRGARRQPVDGALSALHRSGGGGHVGAHLVQLIGGAELDEFGARFGGGNVPRRHEKGVARLVDLDPVRICDGDLSGEEVTPVWAGTAVAG